jgi:hypothetical protein
VGSLISLDRAMFDCRACSLLQFAFCSLEKGRADFHMEVLAQSYRFNPLA